MLQHRDSCPTQCFETCSCAGERARNGAEGGTGSSGSFAGRSSAGRGASSGRACVPVGVDVPAASSLDGLKHAASLYALQALELLDASRAPLKLNPSAVKTVLGLCSLGKAPVADAAAEQKEPPAEVGFHVVKVQ